MSEAPPGTPDPSDEIIRNLKRKVAELEAEIDRTKLHCSAWEDSARINKAERDAAEADKARLSEALRAIEGRDSHIDASPRGDRKVIYGEFAQIARAALPGSGSGWRTMDSRACSLCGATDRCDACNEVIGVAEALPSRSLTDRKWLDPECGKEGCQSLVWKGRYESAVNGRRGFREAFRSAHQSWKIAEDALASISGERVPQRFPEPSRDLAARALREARSHFIPAAPTTTGGR